MEEQPVTDAETRDLVRYWFTFDLTDHEPKRSDHMVLDGGDGVWRLLSQGAGVTGYDKEDCLRLLQEVLGQELPPGGDRRPRYRH